MPSLDGLRGIAALVVVLHHCALTLPGPAAQYRDPDPSAPWAWLAYTPAHLLWAGGEAVLVFFVLSGLVLARPGVLGARRTDWVRYYRKRLVRLYVPVVAAVALTGAILVAVPRVVADWHSWWLDAHALPVSLVALAHDAFLLDDTGWSNSALWSLRYEVFFSLLLPLFIVLVRHLETPVWATVPWALFGIGWAASAGHELISYLFVFAVGVLLARGLPTLSRWGSRVGTLPAAGACWMALLVAAGGLLLTEWWLRLAAVDPTLWLPLGRPGATLGAAVLVFCCLHCPVVRHCCESRPLQWLGGISFSLYLVHEPLVVSVAVLAPSGRAGFALTTGIGLVVSLVAAVVFHRLVERPSQALAEWAGRVGRRRRTPVVGAAPRDTVEMTVPPVVARPSARASTSKDRLVVHEHTLMEVHS